MRFLIQTMTCGGCARGVTKAILTVDPQATVDADPASRTVTVQSSLPRGRFLSALEADGFPAQAQ
jgi:copper chaperone